MITHNDIRKIALALPETSESEGSRQFSIAVNHKGKPKGMVWAWMERVHPKKPKVPNPNVVAVTTCDLLEKDLLIASEPTKFFTEPHYNGYPAVLVRMAEVSVDEMKRLLISAWRCKAPAEVVGQFDEQTPQRDDAAKTTRRTRKKLCHEIEFAY